MQKLISDNRESSQNHLPVRYAHKIISDDKILNFIENKNRPSCHNVIL